MHAKAELTNDGKGPGARIVVTHESGEEFIFYPMGPSYANPRALWACRVVADAINSSGPADSEE